MPTRKDPSATNPGTASTTPAPVSDPAGTSTAAAPQSAPTPEPEAGTGTAAASADLAASATPSASAIASALAGRPEQPRQAPKSATESEPEPDSEPETAEQSAEPAPPASRPTVTTTGEAEATAEGEAVAEAAGGAGPAEPAPAGPAAAEPGTAEPGTAEPEAEAATAADPGDGGDGPAEAAAASSPGRPRGPVLAAAGIVGTLLIAAPFLIPAFADDKPDHPVHAQSAGGTDLGSAADSSPAVGYGSASPSPSAKPSASASAKKHAASVAAPVVEPQSESTVKTKPTASPSATKKAAKKPTARDRANTASSQGKVLLKNVTTGLCADVPNYGNGKVNGPVNQYPCNGTSADNQLWNLIVHTEVGKGPDGSVLFTISNIKDGLCFDLPYYGAASGGTRITEFPCQTTKSDNQFWWLDPRSDGTYWIRNYASRDLCLNVAGEATGGNDAALQIGTCNDSSSDDDHWYFAKS